MREGENDAEPILPVCKEILPVGPPANVVAKRCTILLKYPSGQCKQVQSICSPAALSVQLLVSRKIDARKSAAQAASCWKGGCIMPNSKTEESAFPCHRSVP